MTYETCGEQYLSRRFVLDDPTETVEMVYTCQRLKGHPGQHAVGFGPHCSAWDQGVSETPA